MRVEHLSDIVDQFDGMIIDQFGVLHDGTTLYPGTLGVLRGLQSRQLPVVVVSNSGKRVEANRRRLLDIGVPGDTFVDVVTSGELAYQAVLAGGAATGVLPRAYVIGKDGEDYGFDGVCLVDDPRDADILLMLSSNAPRTSLDDYRRLLVGLSQPAICCNPDRWMLTRGGLQPGAGAIAALYEELGGEVTWIGKPYPAIYQYAASVLGSAARVLCIGDSPEHDVAGGKAAGLATMLITTGVSAGVDGATVSPAPDYWMEAFTW